MDKKDLFIKSKLQEDKNIPKDIDELIKNFKGGDIKMENNFNKSGKGKVAKIIAIAACFILVALVGVALLGQQNGQIIKVGGKDKVEGRKDLDIKDNNQSIVVKKVSYSKLNELLVNELSKGGNVASNNKIKSVNVNEITIYTNEFCKAQGLAYLSEEYKDKIVGYCVYTMEFEDIQGLSLAGSKGEPYGTYKNTLLNGTMFEYNPETGKIELVSSLDFVNEGAANRQTIYDIEIDNSIGNNDVFAKIYDKQYKMLVETGGKVASNNKIKKVFINSIQIDTEEYLKAQGLESTPANRIEGYCSYTIEFEDIEGLELAGSKGKVHGIIGNYLVEGGPWDYNKSEIEGVDNTAVKTEEVEKQFRKIFMQNVETMQMIAFYHKEFSKGKEFSDEAILHILPMLEGDTKVFNWDTGELGTATASIDGIESLANLYFAKTIQIPEKYLKEKDIATVPVPTGFGIVKYEILSIKSLGNDEYVLEIEYIYGVEGEAEHEKIINVFTIKDDGGHIILKTLEKK